jgi:hypothetical protein
MNEDYRSKIVAEFGIWKVVENQGIVGSIKGATEYNIAADRLWETHRGYSNSELKIYEWPIHISSKTWAKETINDFNTAFCFALSYFKKQHLERALKCSFHETILIQKTLLERYK